MIPAVFGASGRPRRRFGDTWNPLRPGGHQKAWVGRGVHAVAGIGGARRVADA